MGLVELISVQICRAGWRDQLDLVIVDGGEWDAQGRHWRELLICLQLWQGKGGEKMGLWSYSGCKNAEQDGEINKI